MSTKVDHWIAQALTTIVAVCLGVRVASWLIAPFLPALAALLVIVTILVVVTKGR